MRHFSNFSVFFLQIIKADTKEQRKFENENQAAAWSKRLKLAKLNHPEGSNSFSPSSGLRRTIAAVHVSLHNTCNILGKLLILLYNVLREVYRELSYHDDHIFFDNGQIVHLRHTRPFHKRIVTCHKCHNSNQIRPFLTRFRNFRQVTKVKVRIIISDYH